MPRPHPTHKFVENVGFHVRIRFRDFGYPEHRCTRCQLESCVAYDWRTGDQTKIDYENVEAGKPCPGFKMSKAREILGIADMEGPLPRYTSFGSYSLVYLTKSSCLCAKCAEEAEDKVIDVRTHDEGDPIECDGCEEEIESSYGPVEGSGVSAS